MIDTFKRTTNESLVRLKGMEQERNYSSFSSIYNRTIIRFQMILEMLPKAPQNTLKVLCESMEIIMIKVYPYVKTSTISSTKPSDMNFSFDIISVL